MQEVIEEKEICAIHGQFSEHKDDLVFLEFNKSRMSKVYDRLSKLDRKDFMIEIKHPLNGKKIHAYKLFYLGYFSVDEVRSYYCSNCNKEYNDKPLQEIFIRLPDNLLPNHIGQFHLKCNHCNSYIIGIGIIREGEKVDTKYIFRDDRGLFIPKTEKDVNNRLEDLLKRAKEGPHFLGGSDLEPVKYWAKNLSLDISSKLREIEKVREEAYFKNYQEQLKNNLDDLINESENITYHGQIEFWEKVEGFEKYLPRLQLNQESKEKSIRLIKNIEEYYRREIKGLKESIEEKKGEIEEAEKEISSIRTEINQYRNLEDLIKAK